MEVPQNIKDRVDDALIHFEDENYEFKKDYVIYVIDNNKFGHYKDTELTELVTSSSRTDGESQIGIATIVTIDKRNKLRKRFDDYVWFSQNIKMAILRISEDANHNDIYVSDTEQICKFVVPLTKLKVKNLKKLGSLINGISYTIRRSMLLSYDEEYGVDICYFSNKIKDKIETLEKGFNIVDSFKEGSDDIVVLEPKGFSII